MGLCLVLLRLSQRGGRRGGRGVTPAKFREVTWKTKRGGGTWSAGPVLAQQIRVAFAGGLQDVNSRTGPKIWFPSVVPEEFHSLPVTSYQNKGCCSSLRLFRSVG